MGTGKFIAMLTLLGAALGCSVGMLLGILFYRSSLGFALLKGTAIGAAAGLAAGLICVVLKNRAKRG